MKIFHSIGEFEGHAGSHLGHSDWRQVTQTHIDQFAAATGDDQWIHVDTERAARGPFGTTIAHGYLTVSLIPVLVRQVYRLEGITMAMNYGLNSVRFPAPLTSGSRVRAGVELRSVTRAKQGYRVVLDVTIEREGSERPVCVAQTISLVVVS